MALTTDQQAFFDALTPDQVNDIIKSVKLNEAASSRNASVAEIDTIWQSRVAEIEAEFEQVSE